MSIFRREHPLSDAGVEVGRNHDSEPISALLRVVAVNAATMQPGVINTTPSDHVSCDSSLVVSGGGVC